MEVMVKGGTHGDIATVAMLTNAVSRVLEIPPGLKTLKDLTISSVTSMAWGRGKKGKEPGRLTHRWQRRLER
jgi:hypothetical protein